MVIENEIRPPFAAPEDFIIAVQTSSDGPDAEQVCWFVFLNNQLLVSHDKSTLPSHHELHLQRNLYLGTFQGTALYAGEVSADQPPPSGWLWSPLRPLHATLDLPYLAIAGYAMQLLHWDRTNRFCGNCGAATVPKERERCRECKSCGALAYPKLSPAVLAIVTKGTKILLASNPQFPEPFFSPLAGFVDPGETLEQCVAREVFEEVGLRVKNIRYLGSQPWPFTNTLMIGFSCEWEEGEIQINPAELSEAAWFDSSNLPQLPPIYSLSRILIDEFVRSMSSLN